jgi:hypothetical protein
LGDGPTCFVAKEMPTMRPKARDSNWLWKYEQRQSLELRAIYAKFQP